MENVRPTKTIKPVMLPCPYYKEIRQTTEYENWHEYCWPDTAFMSKYYPCVNCELQPARYQHFLKESVERANKSKTSNIHLFRKICKKLAGTFVQLGNNNVGLLVGCTTTLEDYYWVYIDADLKVRFDTCVDSCKSLKNIPANLSILDWLRKNQSHELYKKVQQVLNESKYDILITPITIYKS